MQAACSFCVCSLGASVRRFIRRALRSAKNRACLRFSSIRCASISAVLMAFPPTRTAEAARGTLGLPVFVDGFSSVAALVFAVGDALESTDRVSVAEADFVNSVFLVRDGTACTPGFCAADVPVTGEIAGAVWRGRRSWILGDGTLAAGFVVPTIGFAGAFRVTPLATGDFMGVPLPGCAGATKSGLGSTQVPTEGRKRHLVVAATASAFASGALAKRWIVHSVAAPSAWHASAIVSNSNQIG